MTVRKSRSSSPRLLKLFLTIGLQLSGAIAHAAGGEVALTFDDLPALTIVADQGYVDRLNAKLLRKLRQHHVPAIGFVNEDKIDQLNRDHQIANLARWLNSGMQLGNHTYSHGSLNELGAQAYIADIERGERVTKALQKAHGEEMRYFRAPYLETGDTVTAKNEVDSWLVHHGYEMAPVTIDADDWEFAEPYDDAIVRHDRREQRHIRREYLAYTAMRIRWAQESAHLLFGRDIAYVVLLHCTRLNADMLGDVLKLFKRAGLHPVSLAEALKDPVYRQRDTYVGKDGIDWLERWADARKVDLPEKGDEDPPADIQAAYDRVDNDRH